MVWPKDFRAFGVADIRRMTAATAAVTLACLFTEWLCYVLRRHHSSYVLSTRTGCTEYNLLIKLCKTLVKDDFSIFLLLFSIYLC